MSDLYKRINSLCKESGTNVTAMCKELDIARSSLSELNAGRTKTLSAEYLSRIANRFNVTIDYLLGWDEKKPTPITEDELTAFDKVMKRMERLSPKEQDRLLQFVDFYLSNQYTDSDK